jgi:non-specific serine/threonine protein kinase
VESASEFPALTLFVERARAVRPDFDLNAENIKTVTSICARLDGLPLVIELIAARMRLMSPQALLDRLSGQFVLTADGMRAASERQKTLHNAIYWSYNLLSPDEQRLFVYLSVFSGSFTLDALETMFSQKGIEKPLPNLIALLLDKSLLKLAPDFEQSSETRYTMLVTIQEYARERLRELGEESEIRNEHLAYFLDLAEQADKKLRGHSQIEWLNRLNSDRDNLRAALNWAIETKQTEIALQMACKLHWFWFVRGDHSEGSQWLRRTLNMPDVTLYPEAQAQALTQLAHHTWLQSGAKEARPLVEQALSVAQAHGHKWNTAKALAILGLVLIFEHNFDEAESTLEKSKGLFQEVGDKWGYAHAVMGLALGLSMQDDRAPSLALHEQGLLLFRGLGDRYFQSVALRYIGKLQVSQDDLTGGITALREALLFAQDLNSKFEIYAVTWYFAEAAQRAGNFRHAVLLFWAAKNIADSIGAWLKKDEIEFQINLEACRTALEDAEYEEAVETGHAMPMEQAIAYALQGSD